MIINVLQQFFFILHALTFNVWLKFTPSNHSSKHFHSFSGSKSVLKQFSVCFCLYFHCLSAFNYYFVVTLDVQNKYICHKIKHFVLLVHLILPGTCSGT